MKIGKISESVLKRSVLKQIKTTKDEVVNGAGIGEDCAILALKNDEAFAVSTNPITIKSDLMPELAVYKVTNNLAAAGAQPIGIMVSALLPQEMFESDLKECMEKLEKCCSELSIQLMGGHTEVTDALNRMILTVTGVGKLKKEIRQVPKKAFSGQDIVMSKWIGLEGTLLLATEKRKELLTKYPSYLMEEAEEFKEFLSVLPEAATAVKSGVRVMHDLSQGGIFAALWEMAEKSGVGLEVDLKKIPVKQETIEICEFFDINPYELVSGGALLMVTEKGNDLVAALEEEKIPAVIIGKITGNKDRVIVRDEERRFLEPPKPDELYKVL